MLEKNNKRDISYNYRGETCLNCELPLEKSDHFCPNCGQKNSTKKLNFSDFFIQLFSGLFNYDSRFQRTVRVMLFSPGKISKDYVNGKRIRYANPFQFYLSASIIFFLVAGLSDNFEGINFENQNKAIDDGITKIQQDSLMQAQLKEISALKNNNIEVDSIINNVAKSRKSNDETYQDIYVPQEKLDTMNNLNRIGTKLQIFHKYFKETRITSEEEALKELEYDETGWNKFLYQRAMRFDLFYTNPKLFADYLINKLPFIIFFYLPVFALFIWLLYIRRPFNYMEHLIFAFHVQTTLFVLYIIGFSIDHILKSDVGFFLANGIFIFYLYKSMRNFYGQGRVKTILKFILLNIIFFTLATFATIIAVIVSFSIF